MIGLLHLEADYVEKLLSFFDFANGGSHEEFLKKSEKNVSSEHPRRTATPVHCVYLAPTI